MSDAIRVGVNGAGGRMGRRIVALTHADPALEVAAAVDAEASGLVGQDIGELAGIGTIGIAVEATLPENVDVVSTSRPLRDWQPSPTSATNGQSPWSPRPPDWNPTSEPPSNRSPTWPG